MVRVRVDAGATRRAGALALQHHISLCQDVPIRMALFKPSAQLARCDECRTFFDPVYGGVCMRCNRLLCATHLYGGFFQRLLGRFVARRTECVRCRARAR